MMNDNPQPQGNDLSEDESKPTTEDGVKVVVRTGSDAPTEAMIHYLRRDGKYKPVYFEHPHIADRLKELRDENELNKEIISECEQIDSDSSAWPRLVGTYEKLKQSHKTEITELKADLETATEAIRQARAFAMNYHDESMSKPMQQQYSKFMREMSEALATIKGENKCPTTPK